MINVGNVVNIWKGYCYVVLRVDTLTNVRGKRFSEYLGTVFLPQKHFENELLI